MLTVGSQEISQANVGSQKIASAYVGSNLVFQESTSRLPAGYTEVEYTQVGSLDKVKLRSFSSSKQVIMDVQPLSYAKSNEYLFYTNVHLSTGYVFFYMQRESATSASITITNMLVKSGIPVSNNGRITIDINLPKNIVKIGGNSYSTSAYSKYAYGSLVLGYGNTPSDSFPTAPAKWYSVKVYNGTELENDYVPCKDPSGNIGMYDLITSTFKKGTNGGGLTAGPAV